MHVKVNAKTLIHYQSSSCMTKRLKQSTFNILNFSYKGSNPVRSRLVLVKVKTSA